MLCVCEKRSLSVDMRLEDSFAQFFFFLLAVGNDSVSRGAGMKASFSKVTDDYQSFRKFSIILDALSFVDLTIDSF